MVACDRSLFYAAPRIAATFQHYQANGDAPAQQPRQCRMIEFDFKTPEHIAVVLPGAEASALMPITPSS